MKIINIDAPDELVELFLKKDLPKSVRSFFEGLEKNYYKEFKKLASLNKWTDKQAERYAELDDKFLLKYGYGPRLKNYLVHDKLYEKFPQLKEAIFTVVPDNADYEAYYNPANNTIAITPSI